MKKLSLKYTPLYMAICAAVSLHSVESFAKITSTCSVSESDGRRTYSYFAPQRNATLNDCNINVDNSSDLYTVIDLTGRDINLSNITLDTQTYKAIQSYNSNINLDNVKFSGDINTTLLDAGSSTKVTANNIGFISPQSKFKYLFNGSRAKLILNNSNLIAEQTTDPERPDYRVLFNLKYESNAEINNSNINYSSDGSAMIASISNSSISVKSSTLEANSLATGNFGLFTVTELSEREEDNNVAITVSDSKLKTNGNFISFAAFANTNNNNKIEVNLINAELDSEYLTYYGSNNVNSKGVMNLSVKDSSITGSAQRNNNLIENITLDNSSWSTKNSTIDNLELKNNSSIIFQNPEQPWDPDFSTLTIKGNLIGAGTFNMKTNIAENEGDKIIVQGTAEGNHKIGVTNQGANVSGHKLTLVETNGGNALFELTNANKRVDLGAYQYSLAKEGNNWVLANSQSAVHPTNPTKPTTPSVNPNNPIAPTTPSVNPSNPSLPATPLLSSLANAQVSLRQALLLLVENDLSGIHERLGEVKNGEKGNVWVRNVNSREKLTALSTGDSETSGFKQNVHSVQVGADAAVTDNFRLGGFVGRSQSNIDFNGDYGDGKVRSNSVGLYATYLADNGIYVDNIVKYSRLKAESDHTEKRHYNAYTVSSELGKQFKLTGDWTITPQVQLAYTHIQGKENEDSLSSVYSRAGVRVAKGFALANGWNLHPYAEINAITSRNNHSKVHYSNAALEVESSRGRFESAVGLNAGIANHRVGLEVSRADGKRYDKPYQIQAVYRYSW